VNENGNTFDKVVKTPFPSGLLKISGLLWKHSTKVQKSDEVFPL